MNFDDFSKRISKIKNLPLPGADSHYKMAPDIRIEELQKLDKAPKKARKAAVMSLFYPKAEETTLLLILRKTYKGVHSNQIGFPGGRVEEYDAIRTFALDRIQQFLVTNKIFIKPNFDVKKYFNSIYGVSEGDDVKKEIILEFTSSQGNYIKALPIHPSQKVLKETEKNVQVSLDLVPNLELQMRILSYGKNVRVLEPEDLALQIQTLLKESLAPYK